MTANQIRVAALKIAAMRTGKAAVINKRRNTRRIIEDRRIVKLIQQLSAETN